MAYLDLVREADATGPLKSIYDAAIQRTGGVANIIRVMSNDARSCQASMGFYISIMKTPGPLSSARREMLATVVSNVNDCFY